MNPLQASIWTNISQFDFDQPLSEYGFSTRLAYENGWSLHFTKRAIAEYKKFMFLAGTSTEMVSPSPIVDIVWHQHLIFTQSYKHFCDILGKQIEHVPSLHNYAEKTKFEIAIDRTHIQYRTFWGEPPADIWFENHFLQKLEKMPQSIFPVQIIVALTIFLPAFLYQFIAPFITPFVQEIDNPFFLLGYWALFFMIALYVFFSRNRAFNDYAKRLYEQGIFQNLSAFELIFMKRKRLADVVHCVVNEMVKNNQIEVQSNNSLKAVQSSQKASNNYEFTVLQTLEALGGEAYYPQLLGDLVKKEIFIQTKNFVQTLEKKTVVTSKYAQLIAFGSLLFTFFLMIGFTRLDLGLTREKPVTFLVFSLLGMSSTALLVIYLTTTQFFRNIVPALFQENLAYRPKVDAYETDFDWQYLMLGNAVMVSSFTPLVSHVERRNETNGGSSSCGSSCSSGGDGGGSSCGGGCGGCGGGGD